VVLNQTTQLARILKYIILFQKLRPQYILYNKLKMDYTCPCSICNSATHNPSKCPELSNGLKDGFYKGGGGGSDSHDDDEGVRNKTINNAVVQVSLSFPTPRRI